MKHSFNEIENIMIILLLNYSMYLNFIHNVSI